MYFKFVFGHLEMNREKHFSEKIPRSIELRLESISNSAFWWSLCDDEKMNISSANPVTLCSVEEQNFTF